MGLRREQWKLLEEFAAANGDGGEGWVAEDCAAQGRRRRTTLTQELAREGLCELAAENVLDTLAQHGGERPSWAARIVPDGLIAVHYRRLRTAVPEARQPEPPRESDPARHQVEFQKAEMELLQTFLTLIAPSLDGFDARCVASAVAQARPVPGAHRWTLDASEEQLDAIEAVFRLEVLTGSARSFHRIRRVYRPLRHEVAALHHGEPQG